MEANVYPIATFTGKILENIEEGKKEYRAKGALDIHGKSVERVIDVVLTISDNAVGYSASFIVPLAEHDIKLPRIVYQKIAEDILVTIKGELICKK